MNAIPLFKIFGIQVYIDYSWFIAFTLITLTLSQGFYPTLYKNLSQFEYILAGAVSAIMLFLSVLLHELSHSLVAIKHGMPVRDIYLFIFGGVAMIEQEPDSPSTEFKIAIAGPLMSFFLALIFFTALSLYPTDDIFNGFLNYMFMVNFALGAFNLIPAFPLDGGRILRSILWKKYGILKATEVASKFGKYFGFMLIGFGIYSLFNGNLINGFWLIFLGTFIIKASKDALFNTKLAVLLSKLKVFNIMHTMNPLDENLSILDFSMFYRPYIRTYLYPVLTSDGRILFIDTRDLDKIPYFKQEEMALKDIVKPIKYYVLPEERLSKVYNLLKRNKLEEIPVIDNDTFLGILRKSDIEAILNRFIHEELLQIKNLS